jgi:hypothetical protein
MTPPLDYSIPLLMILQLAESIAYLLYHVSSLHIDPLSRWDVATLQCLFHRIQVGHT